MAEFVAVQLLGGACDGTNTGLKQPPAVLWIREPAGANNPPPVGTSVCEVEGVWWATIDNPTLAVRDVPGWLQYRRSRGDYTADGRLIYRLIHEPTEAAT